MLFKNDKHVFAVHMRNFPLKSKFELWFRHYNITFQGRYEFENGDTGKVKRFEIVVRNYKRGRNFVNPHLMIHYTVKPV